jgi:hypothetical protein
MNKKTSLKARLLGTLLAVGITGAAHATGTWTNGQQVISNIIWTPGYHGLYVEAGTYHDPQACNGANRLYLIHPTTDADTVATNRLLALITAAMAQGKTVSSSLMGAAAIRRRTFTGIQVNN